MPANEQNEVKASDIKAQLDKIGNELKSEAEKAIAEAAKSIGMSTSTKEKVDELLIEQSKQLARLEEVEQKSARRGNGGEIDEKSIGDTFVNSEEFKNFQANRSAKKAMAMQFKAVTSITSATTGTGGAGDLVRTERVNGILQPALRRMTVRDLITPGRTASNAIEYVKETGFQNMAAVVAETASKPQSDLAFDLLTQSVVTIAHWVKASKQILDDAPMLASYIDGRLRYGLEYVEEGQLLNGSGSGGNLNGIYTQATAYSAPAGGYGGGDIDPTAIDILRLAMLQAELALFPATGGVINPTQWSAIETTKDSEGRYIIGNPNQQGSPTLWGRPFVATPAMANDAFLVGAFKLGAQVFDREDANVQVSTEDADNFTKNMVTIRAEERLGLAVYRPEAFIKGDLGLVA